MNFPEKATDFKPKQIIHVAKTATWGVDADDVKVIYLCSTAASRKSNNQ